MQDTCQLSSIVQDFFYFDPEALYTRPPRSCTHLFLDCSAVIWLYPSLVLVNFTKIAFFVGNYYQSLVNYTKPYFLALAATVLWLMRKSFAAPLKLVPWRRALAMICFSYSSHGRTVSSARLCTSRPAISPFI